MVSGRTLARVARAQRTRKKMERLETRGRSGGKGVSASLWVMVFLLLRVMFFFCCWVFVDFFLGVRLDDKY